MIAIWALGYKKECIDNDYPVYTVYKQQINNDEELEEWFANWYEKYPNIYFNDFSLVGRWSYIFDEQIDEWIMRYNFLKSYNISSYGNTFDDLPAIWVDALNIMNTQSILVSEDINKNG